jgi:putative transposase
MQGVKSAGHAQRFVSAYGPIAQHFRPRRHLLSAADYRQEMRQRFARWAEITGTERVAQRADRTGERPPLA